MATKPVKYTPEYVTEILNKMNATIKAEEKADKIKTMFLNELFLNAGISPHNWVVNVHNKYKKEDWYKDLYGEIKERLHMRLYQMVLKNPRLTGFAIWNDRVNHGIKEPTSEVSEIQVEATFKDL